MLCVGLLAIDVPSKTIHENTRSEVISREFVDRSFSAKENTKPNLDTGSPGFLAELCTSS
jgi:hypothetical protein